MLIFTWLLKNFWKKWSKKYKSLTIIGLDCLEHQASLIFGWSGPVRLLILIVNFSIVTLDSVFKTTKIFTLEVSNRQYVHMWRTRLHIKYYSGSFTHGKILVHWDWLRLYAVIYKTQSMWTKILPCLTLREYYFSM